MAPAEPRDAGPVVLVSVHYYRDHVGTSLRIARRLAHDLGAAEWIAVSNNPSLSQKEMNSLSGGANCVQHDNSGREFGAYQAGVDASASRLDANWVVFINDTLGVHSPFFTERRKRLIESIRAFGNIRTPVAIGEEEHLAQSFSIEGCRTHRWLTTHVFALNRVALAAIDRRIYCPEIERLVVGGAERSLFFAPSVDAGLATHIASWLFDAHRAIKWYGAAPLSIDNAEVMAEKARCILQEKYLSARLDHAGAWIQDIKTSVGIVSSLARRWERAKFRVSTR